MSENETAAKMWIDMHMKGMARHYDHNIKAFACALQAAKDFARSEERERILNLISAFPQGADGPADAGERVKWAIDNISSAISEAP